MFDYKSKIADQELIDHVSVDVKGEGTQSIFMIHGWPDTSTVWNDQICYFSSSYKCISFTLPGYDKANSRSTYSVAQVNQLIKSVLDRYASGQKVILMVHDWGAAFGYQFYNQYPEMISKIIGVDIGDFDTFFKRTPLITQVKTLTYHPANILSFVLGRFGGDQYTKRAATKFNAPCKRDLVHSSMNWPYFMYWFGGKDAFRKTFKPFNPSCPFLFIYGTQKDFHFHDQQWAQHLSELDGNRVIAMDTDHWPMVRAPSIFNAEVDRWLSGN
ncbi:hypothetical protein A3715_00020 [Oleiphilus sp. HI0009]|nr:hypothetical protein A3715_00020 [Oleiphilus sp. HI0009]